MRLIGEISNSIEAERLISFLLTKGISAKAEPEGDLFEVWVKEEDLIDEASQIYEEFVANPNAPEYQNSIQIAQQIAQEQEQKRLRAQKNVVHVSQTSGVGPGSRMRRPLTILLIVISALVFFFTDLGKDKDSTVFRAMSYVSINPEEGQQFAGESGDSAAVELHNLKKGEIWRVITPIFLHYDIFHIVFNMLWLYQLGQVIEHKLGTLYLAVLVLVVAAVSNNVENIVVQKEG